MKEPRYCHLCSEDKSHEDEEELVYLEGKYFCVNTRKRVWSEDGEDDDEWSGLTPEQAKELENETIEPAATKKITREVITKWRIVKPVVEAEDAPVKGVRE